MDPELRSVIRRYSVVGIVLSAAVVWAVVYTNEKTTIPPTSREAEHGGTTTRSTEDEGAPRIASPAVAPPPASKAPSNDRLYVDKMGVKRVDCKAACDFEAYCGLRDPDVCLANSCEPARDVRKVNASDFKWRDAGTCADIAASPCEEACWKRGECTGDHGGDPGCTSACLTLVKQRLDETYAESRCVIEKPCQDLPLCASVTR